MIVRRALLRLSPRLSLGASRLVTLGIVGAVAFSACAGSSASGGPSGVSSVKPSQAAEAKVSVVASTTVLADLVGKVGGDLVDVAALVPKDADPHTYEPTPSDIGRVAGADLIVTNGLGIDDWMRTVVLDAKNANATLVVLAENLPGVTYLGSEVEPGATEAPTRSGVVAANPHLWMNVAYAELYVRRIIDALKAADPVDASAFEARGSAYLTRLTELDAYAKAQVAALPVANRKVVAYHDAFPYLAAAYGLTSVDTVIQAPGQDASAADIAALIDLIRTEGVKAIFAEAQFPLNVVTQIANETGAKVVANLYDDSLGNPPADSYEGMMRFDIDTIVAALK